MCGATLWGSPKPSRSSSRRRSNRFTPTCSSAHTARAAGPRRKRLRRRSLPTGSTGDDADRAVRLALRGEHPDLIRIDPPATITATTRSRFSSLEASRTPVEGRRKVIVADRFHTANATVIGRLLKTLEEPPESTIIVLLNEDVPDEQSHHRIPVCDHSIPGSRRMPMPSRGSCERGVSPILPKPSRWRRVATFAAPSTCPLTRTSSSDTKRGRACRSRLDGTGAAVAIAVEELRALIDDAQGPIDARHLVELEELAEREEQVGSRGSGRRDLEAAHKREIRRLRVDELKFGLATLAGVYRDRVVAEPRAGHLRALDALRNANEALIRNPNEALLLQALFLQLSSH